MSTSRWNWAWVASAKDTKKSSESIEQAGGTVYAYRAASRGQISATELRASSESAATNLNTQWRLWKTYVRPYLDSLPAGTRDTRWRSGKGLPPKIDALNYGIQGTTLFVYNDASSTGADGRYWDTDDERPKTIAEALEDIWDEISDLTASSSEEDEDTDLEPLWRAVGHRYKDASLTSLSTSLDYRTEILESDVDQLTNDLYGASEGFSFGFGIPLNYSVAINLDYILKLHNITGGWQADPSGMNHSAVTPAAHVHPYTEVTPVPSSSLTQARVGPLTSLYNDILRLRYEIQAAKGSTSWQNDAVDPVSGGALSGIQAHINYIGSGTATAANCHALDYSDVGADTIFGYIADFIGMSNYTTSETPTYTSTNIISNGDSLETAIGKLDASIVSEILWTRLAGVISPATSTDELSVTAPVIFSTSTAEDALTIIQDNDSYDPDVLVIENNTSGLNPNLGHSIRLIGSNAYHTISSDATLYLAGDAVLIESADGDINLYSTGAIKVTSDDLNVYIDETLYVKNSQVGINCDDPSSLLDVQSDGVVTGNTDIIEITNTAQAASMTDTRSSILWKQWYYNASAPSVKNSGKITVGTEGNWDGTTRTYLSYMAFFTAQGADDIQEAMRITGSGYVGIGTDDPNTILHITQEGLASATTDFITLTKTANDNAMVDTGTAIVFKQYYYDATPAAVESGKISVITEEKWTATASTQIAGMAFQVVDAGSLRDALYISHHSNIGIGLTSFDATAEGCLVIYNGTSPAAHTDDAIYIFSKDTSNNTASLALYTEEAVVNNGSAPLSVTHSLPITINGTQYNLCLNA